MAKDPLATMMSQAVKPGSVPAPAPKGKGTTNIPPVKGVQKSAPAGFTPGRNAPPPPPPAGRSVNFSKGKK